MVNYRLNLLTGIKVIIVNLGHVFLGTLKGSVLRMSQIGLLLRPQNDVKQKF